MRKMKMTGRFLRVTLSFCMLPLLTSPALGQAQSAQKTVEPPEPGPIRPFDFPVYQTKVLANGLSVYVIEDHRQPMVSYDLLIRAGATSHSPSQAGLASLTAQLLRKGTASRSAQDIAKSIDEVGGTLSSSAGQDMARATATVMKTSEDLGIELLADIVLNPAFSQGEIDRLLRQSLSGLEIQYTDPEYLAPLAAARVIYGKHPYGYPVDGTPQTLRAIKRDEIVTFHKAHYVPKGALLAVSGDTTAAVAFKKAEKYFGGWAAAEMPEITHQSPPAPSRKILIIDKPDAVQTQIVVGSRAIKRNDADYLPLLVANQVFGGSFNSRLNMKLRAKEGLTYGASSRFQTRQEAGSFLASTFTRTEETAKTINMLLDLLKEFRNNPVTEGELKEAKAYLSGSFSIGSETPGQVASRVLTLARFGLPADYWNTYRETILNVTPDQIRKAVTRYVDPDKVSIVAVGNAKAFAGSLAELGKVEQILFSDLDVIRPDLRRPKEPTTPASPEAATRGMELIKAAATAVGGIDTLGGIKDSTFLGSGTLITPQGDLEAEIESKVLYPDKIKITISLPFGKMVQAYDGTTAWLQQGPRVLDLPESMNKELKRSIMLSGTIEALRSALAGQARVQALKQGEWEGKPMDALLWEKEGTSVKFLLDPKTHLIVTASFRSVTPQGSADTENVMTEYGVFSGVQIPRKIISNRNGRKFSELNIKEVKFNSGLDPSEFSKP